MVAEGHRLVAVTIGRCGRHRGYFGGRISDGFGRAGFGGPHLSTYHIPALVRSFLNTTELVTCF